MVITQKVTCFLVLKMKQAGCEAPLVPSDVINDYGTVPDYNRAHCMPMLYPTLGILNTPTSVGQQEKLTFVKVSYFLIIRALERL